MELVDAHDGSTEAMDDEAVGYLGVPERPKFPRIFRDEYQAPAGGDQAGAGRACGT